MAHIHGVYDTDTHFKLDAVTKELSVGNEYKKVKVIQHDHNSERFSVELPRYIEGHDMLTCNNVEVHYLNVDSQTKEESVGLYMVDDLQESLEDENVVVCSWLISANGTKYVGPLFFVIRFECVTDGNIDYALNTLVYEGIYVGKGIYNTDVIAAQYADVLEQWKKDLGDGVSDEQIERAVEKYLDENPISASGGSSLGVDVNQKLGKGSAYEPIDLSQLGITDYTSLYFSKGTYYVSPLNLANVKNVTMYAEEARIIATGDYFIKGVGCEGFGFYGGEINGNSSATYGIQLDDSKRCEFHGVDFKNFGSANTADTKMLGLFGDCTGFDVENCTFDGCTSGVTSGDNIVHSYGLFVNRLGSSKTYSKNGNIENCTFNNITTISVGSGDTNATYGDGEGIFVQAPPYLDDDQNLVIPYANIKISGCIFTNCKKRGIKLAARGVIIEDCILDGSFWFAGIDVQYGHANIKNCTVSNTSDYTKTLTSAIALSDGGVTIDGCKISATYIGSNGYEAYHPGIRFNTRLTASVIADDVLWDTCVINDCFFDGVSRGVYADDTNTGAVGKYVLSGVEITNCHWGKFVNKYGVELKNTMFASINVMKFTDFQFDYGKNRTEVRSVLGQDASGNEIFSYPYLNEVTANYGFELHSCYWSDEPMSAYDKLPTCPNVNIMYASSDNGANMGGVLQKEYGAYGSKIVGTRPPEEITSTRGKQMLYNSKRGDIYIDSGKGTMYICTAQGTADFIGTWKALDLSGTVSDEQIGQAVENYLAENPVQAGATEAQAQQIAKNTQDIGTLSGQKVDKNALSLGFGTDGKLYIMVSGIAIGDGVEIDGTITPPTPSEGVAVFVADFSGNSPNPEQFYSWEGRTYKGAIYDALSNIECVDGVANLTSIYDSENNRWVKQQMCTGGLFESDNFTCKFKAKFCGLSGSWNNVITYGTGTHWTDGMYSDGVKWPAGGEIDAFEQSEGYTETPNNIVHTAHWGAGTESDYPKTHEKLSGSEKGSTTITTDEWHDFKFSLKNGVVTCWIDDVQTSQFDLSERTVSNNYMLDYKPFLKPQAFYVDCGCVSTETNTHTDYEYVFEVSDFEIYQDELVECTGLEIYPQMWNKGSELIFPTGAELYLDRIYIPSNVSNKACTWKSSDETVATVVQGYVKTLKVGNATITATCGGVSASYNLIVSANANVPCVKVVGDESVSIVEGKTIDVTSYLYPRFTTDNVAYVSNDEEIATFENGVIKGVSVGQTTVIITCGTKSATISVDVLEGAIPVIAYDLSGISYDGEAYTGETSVIANTGSYGSSFDGSLTQIKNNYYKGEYSADGYILKATLDSDVTGLNLRGVAHTVIYKGVKLVKTLHGGSGSTDIYLESLFDDNGNAMPSIDVQKGAIKYGNVNTYTHTFSEENSNIAISSDGTTAKLFINGELVKSGSDGYSASNPTSLDIKSINGNIESFEIYMEQLSDEELIEITSIS